MNSCDVSVNVAGVQLKNPVMPASGCFGFGREYSAYYSLDSLGAIVVKATTDNPRAGNPTPRVAETTAGMLNSIGLANPGVDYVISHELPWLSPQGVPIIVNVAGETSLEYCNVVERLCASGLIAGIELNVSCPNVSCGGLSFGVDPAILEKLVSEVRKVCSVPLFVKLSPNVADIKPLAVAAENGGADALSLINTLLGMRIDVHKRSPVLGRRIGGLSGPAIKPVAIRMVYEASQVVDIPIIGMGGISTGEDAIEFIMAGATAVQVGTANFTDPYACPRIIQEIEEYMVVNQIQSLSEIRGCVR